MRSLSTGQKRQIKWNSYHSGTKQDCDDRKGEKAGDILKNLSNDKEWDTVFSTTALTIRISNNRRIGALWLRKNTNLSLRMNYPS